MKKIFKCNGQPVSRKIRIYSECIKKSGKILADVAKIATSLILSMTFANAADTAAGAGSGVAYGTGSNAPKAENVAVGKNAKIQYSNGASNATGDIAVGDDANINNYASQGGSIAVGSNAQIENMAGGGEASFAFGQTTYSGSWFSSARIPADPTKAVGSIAIGQNTFARTGSTMIGIHNYAGQLGDTTVDSNSTRTTNLNVYSTTLGTNSHSNGAFTTTTGVYNIISSDYNGGWLANPSKNLGATIYGSLNSIESMTGGYYAGIANSVTGIANKVANSNGALVYGAGNEITNSIVGLWSVPTESGDSAKAFQDSLMTTIKEYNGAGSTMAFGGGNMADYTLRSALLGVNNTLTGTAGNESVETMLNGYKNTATNVKNTTIIGSENTISDSTKNIVIGDKHKVTAVSNNVILGSSDNELETKVADVVMIGHNAEANIENSVALGSNAKTISASASTKGVGAYVSDSVTIGTVTRTLSFAGGSPVGVVSVGDVGRERRIQNVAAGLISATSTDAINGSQLYSALQNLSFSGGSGVSTVVNKEETVVAGDNIEVTSQPNSSNSKEYKVALKKDVNVNSVTSKTVTATEKVKVGNTIINSNGVTVKNGPSVTSSGVNAGNQRITNVKAGVNPTDAVNKSQLDTVDHKVRNVEGKLHDTRKEMRGIGANVAAGVALPQVYVPGKSMIAAAVGTYKDESALAVGWSRSSDTGKVIIKLTGTANTVGDVSGGVGVGYQY
ncbi:YadA family autotransporter adhesin [Basfia succiniciproducens]|uniref:Autotransporter adhesin n=1 Tax=Basfia succiniciproducens TaxID=653940 RepID=A0A1G5C6R0_9PAST|nr:YadA-like family protein [Basfia succiniciproducens]QIM68797.1 hypothetical protein A4G13_05045 [Basfia succiniciproducens]SCX98018.1 Autotransporter adhesin [Basfia succiniciproducens]